MSMDQVWTVIGRAVVDSAFLQQLGQDWSGTLRQAGYTLEGPEQEAAQQALNQLLALTRAAQGAQNPMVAEETTKLQIETLRRMSDFSKGVLGNLQGLFVEARGTFKKITIMNIATFVIGFALFLFAAIYAVAGHEKAYSILFGGLGVTAFISVFIQRPIEQSQRAVSQLAQIEIVILSFVDQAMWWEGYANLQPIDPARIEKASASLEQRTIAALQMLEDYVESSPSTAGTPTKATVAREPQALPRSASS
jgi:hypothetical protein